MRDQLRFFYLTSLACILLAATILITAFRNVAIEGIVQVAETSNTALAQAALDPIRAELGAYLDSVARVTAEEARTRPLPPALEESFGGLLQLDRITRVKVYNRDGLVVFSTDKDQIGENSERNGGFEAAMAGKTATALVYRDTFNQFDGVTEDDNLVQTYLPVRLRRTGLVMGVLEIYTDVNALVQRTERIELEIVAGTALVMLVLYGALVLIVRRAATLTEVQQQIIQERTATLETLSAQMLRGEENERKRIATELHEGLAQTLAAIKLIAESDAELSGGARTGATHDVMVSTLRRAIQEVRTITTDLRPPSLDDLGLLPTIKALCEEFESIHPGLSVETDLSLQEAAIPAQLKIIIYRNVELALKAIAGAGGADRIRLSIRAQRDTISLVVEENAAAARPDLESTPDSVLGTRFHAVEERTVLSGGAFTAVGNAFGGATISASWPRRG